MVSIQINLSDLPKAEFKVTLNENTINSIISNLRIKGDYLYNKLIKLDSQRNNKIETIKKHSLYEWKKGKRIPVDCFELLCKLSNKNLKEYQNYVYELSLGYSKNNWNISFPIIVDKNIILISEAIRTEGNIIKGKFKNCP